MHLDCQMEMTGMKGSAKGEAAENVLDDRSWPVDKGRGGYQQASRHL